MGTITATRTIDETFLEEKDRDKAVLDARYRCDRCGAQAYVRTILESNNALYWCGHHAKTYIPLMKAQNVLQETYSEEIRLIENRKQGSEN
jgi:hypothetical protein